jgi:hypothetical protein
MKLTKKERFEVLKLEMGLIQNTLDKYDDLIFRNRNWYITLWTGAVGLGISSQKVYLLFLAILLTVLYWFIEGVMRHQYWYKYVDRYRTIRERLNTPAKIQVPLSAYDLTNHYNRGEITGLEKLKRSFFKLEPLIVFSSMGIAAAVVHSYLLKT